LIPTAAKPAKPAAANGADPSNTPPT
jgi:hypothetical protein